MKARTWVLALGLGWAVPLWAQEIPPLPRASILVVDAEAMFLESAFGRRLMAEIEAAGIALAAENREIEAALIAEEQELTDLRSSLSAQEFRSRADAFDQQVQRLRREQDQKSRDLANRSETARRAFLQAAQPVLETVMDRSGALVLLDRRSIFLARDAIDVTDAAIARIDLAIGDGNELLPDSP